MNSRSWLVLALCFASAASSSRVHAAPSAPGFPKKVSGLVTSPLATGRQPDGMVRLYFSIGDELHCLQANGRGCDGFPVALGQKVAVLGLPAVGDLDGDGVADDDVAAARREGDVSAVRHYVDTCAGERPRACRPAPRSCSLTASGARSWSWATRRAGFMP